MSVPTVVLNEATPAGGDKIREGDDRIREFKKQVREILNVDHKYESSGQHDDMGKHDKVAFLESADLPAGAEGKPILGAQTVDGRADLVFVDENNVDHLVLPAGIVHDFAGTIAAIPIGFLFCNGDAVSRTTYIRLFGVIGTLHGIGNGSTTFNLPDYRDVGIIGAKEDDGGTPKTNVTGALTTSGGAATHTLTTAQIPVHAHPISCYREGTSGATSDDPASTINDQNASSQNTNSTGGGESHNNLHPYKVTVKMIKT